MLPKLHDWLGCLHWRNHTACVLLSLYNKKNYFQTSASSTHCWYEWEVGKHFGMDNMEHSVDSVSKLSRTTCMQFRASPTRKVCCSIEKMQHARVSHIYGRN